MREKSFLTVKDVARILNCKPTTVYGWARSGVLPAYKIGGLVRFDPDVLEECIGSRKIKPRKAIPERLTFKAPAGSLRELDGIIRRAIDSTVVKKKASVYNPQKGKPDQSARKEVD